jgi:hypothetical protein
MRERGGGWEIERERGTRGREVERGRDRRGGKVG